MFEHRSAYANLQTFKATNQSEKDNVTLNDVIKMAGSWWPNPFTAKNDHSLFNPFYEPFKYQLLGIKCVFKHRDLQMSGLKLNKYQ